VLNDASKSLHDQLDQGAIKRSQVIEYARLALESSALIAANANRAAQLIQSFKQVAVDQTSEQRRQFELNAFVADLVMSLNPSLKKSRITIQLVRGPATISMDSYPGLLAQVLTNLAMNAMMHAFGQRSEGQITIELSLEQDMVTIRFADDGIGIHEAILAKIFDPFFTTRRGQGGTGLGLNIVFNIVNKQFGGTITAHNREQGGALFVITIPRVTRELTEQEYIHGTVSKSA
jgi:two-component system NtrC family sensor kinase